MRRERPSVALTLRMVLAAVLTPVLVVGATVAAFVVLDEWRFRVGLVIVAIAGVAVALEERRKAIATHELAVHEAPELHATLERLCVQADLPKPVLAVATGQQQPNSWVTSLPGRTPQLCVTQGLLELLTPAEVEAVLAHELAHVAHRDATIMTLVGLPGAALVRGAHGSLSWGMFAIAGIFAWLIGGLASLGTNVLSRARETAADATAARLTGRPSALASALLKMSGEVQRLPAEDLRAAQALNAFNLLPVEGEPAAGWRGRLAHARPVRALTATHPSLERRLAALERLEAQRRSLR